MEHMEGTKYSDRGFAKIEKRKARGGRDTLLSAD